MFVETLTKTWGLFACDVCATQFKLYFCQAKGKKLHFCCRKCSSSARQSGGLIQQLAAATNLERYGVKNPYQSELIKAKIRNTLKTRYGADNPQKIHEFKEKSKATSLERYGVDNPAKSELVKEKERNTFHNKTSEEKQEILNRRCTTNLDRYGVAFQMQRKDVLENFDFSLVSQKGHQTKLRKGSYGNVSIIELELKSELEALFESVQHQVSVTKRWTVDFYLSSIDTYVQLDGVYWHGLNRPLEEIKLFKSSKDRSIYGKFLRDQEQNEWFVSNSKRLVRFTDKEVTEWRKKGILKEQLKARLMMVSESSPSS